MSITNRDHDEGDDNEGNTTRTTDTDKLTYSHAVDDDVIANAAYEVGFSRGYLSMLIHHRFEGGQAGQYAVKEVWYDAMSKAYELQFERDGLSWDNPEDTTEGMGEVYS